MVAFPQSFVSPEHGEPAGRGPSFAAGAVAAHGAAGTCGALWQSDAPLLFAVPAEPPRYCSMLALDIQSFNDHRRGADTQRYLRAAMYALLVQAFDRSGLPWSACHHEDRGDGVLVVAPSGAPATALIDPLIDYLRAGLRSYNRFCNDLAKMSLRVSAHAGLVYFDNNGVCGHAVTHLFRLLDAGEFKKALTESGAEFGMVSSETLYQEVISPGCGLIDAEMYAPIDVVCKETSTRAWLYLPPVRNPFLHRSDAAGTLRSGATERRSGEVDHRQSARSRFAVSAGRMPTPLAERRARWQRQPLADEEGQDVEGPTMRDTISIHARLLAAMAASTRGWLAGVPETIDVAKFRGWLHQGQHVQHASP